MENNELGKESGEGKWNFALFGSLIFYDSREILKECRLNRKQKRNGKKIREEKLNFATLDRLAF